MSRTKDSDTSTASLGALQVLDFSRVLAGPFATMMLGDLGATVTKIERPGGGDETRSWGPPFDENGDATYFQSVNRNKSSITLDLNDPLALEEARRMALRCDVLVENFRPGVMDGHRLGYEALSASNPRLVYCSITGFGPSSSLPGYDLLIQALGGLMSLTGEPDGAPMKVGVALVDVLAGLFATVGILAALEHRHETGRGQLVEVDLFSALLASLVNQGAAFTVGHEIPRRMGNQHPSVSPYQPIATRRGELVLAVGNDRQFQALCETIGAPELAGDPRFCTNGARVANRGALIERLERALAARDAEDWARELTERRVPAGAVNDIAGAFRLAETLGLGPTVAVEREDGGSVELTRNPIRLSASPVSYRLPPPALPTGERPPPAV